MLRKKYESGILKEWPSKSFSKYDGAKLPKKQYMVKKLKKTIQRPKYLGKFI